jgi:hypothetical protein
MRSVNQTSQIIQRLTKGTLFRIGIAAWLLLIGIVVVPIVLHQLSFVIDSINVWNLPLRHLAAFLGIGGVACFVFSWLKVEVSGTSSSDSQLPETPEIDKDFGKKIHPRIRERLKGYRFWSGFLMSLFVLLGMVSVISALIAATYTDALKQGIWLKFLILTSAVSSALITAFNLQGKSSDVWRAFRHLEQAILEYELNSSDVNKLLAAYKEAENMVGFFEFKDEKNSN